MEVRICALPLLNTVYVTSVPFESRERVSRKFLPKPRAMILLAPCRCCNIESNLSNSIQFARSCKRRTCVELEELLRHCYEPAGE